MLLSQLFAPFVILEAKARIEHPEDLVFDNGLRGAKIALQILQTTAERPQSVSIKFDGSPALIYGWRDDQFVLTDKAGFGAKGYDGMTTSAEALQQMLMARKQKDTSPEAVERRSKYAQTIASLYPILKSAVPRDFEGYAQGDLLWVGVPPIVNGMYEFKPNKIVYRIPVNSDLGKQIARSQVGMVVHSVFYSQQDQEPEALRDVASLGWRVPGKLVVVPHEIEFQQRLQLDEKLTNQLLNLLRSQGNELEQLFNPLALSDLNIKAFPGLLKSFVAYKSAQGDDNYSQAPQEFIEWLISPSSKASKKMQQSVTEWIRNNIDGYNTVWLTVELLTQLKLNLKNQMDQQVGNVVSAHLDDQPGHEGFVSVTPQGVIKLVNRAEFMKKDELREQMHSNNKHVAWAFGRMNPPTLGHQQLVDTVAHNARGGDYWIFLSHSQDPKKNPLPYAEKKHFAQQIMPQHASHFDVPEDIRTFLQAADWLYKQGYRSMTFVAGSDRLPDFEKHLAAWNSASVREKAPLMIDGQMQTREPISIDFASAGERDPDAEGLSGISGTKAREAVAQDDLGAFQASTGVTGKLARSMFDSVKSHMQASQPKKPTKIKEGVFDKITQKFFGKKPEPVAEPSRFPKVNDSIPEIIEWVKQWVNYTKQKKDGNPADLFNPNSWHYIFNSIHAGTSYEKSQQVKQALMQDPEIGPWITNAPAYQPRDGYYGSNSDSSNWQTSTTSGSAGDIDLLHRLTEDHSKGTIVKLRLQNECAQQLYEWCQQQGISCLDPHEFHMTLVFSTTPAPQLSHLHATHTRIPAQIKGWKILGEHALVLDLHSPASERLHKKLLECGATHSYPDFIPHTSVVYGWAHPHMPREIPSLELVFEMVEVEPLDPNWGKSIQFSR